MSRQLVKGKQLATAFRRAVLRAWRGEWRRMRLRLYARTPETIETWILATDDCKQGREKRETCYEL